MPKSLKISLGMVVILAAGLVVLMASQLAQKQLNKGKMSHQQCAQVAAREYNVILKNNAATPRHIDARQCDKLTITNQDDSVRLMAFGVHDAHKPYDEVSEKALRQNQSLTVTLVQTGDFLVHDHNQEAVQTTFTVTSR